MTGRAKPTTMRSMTDHAATSRQAPPAAGPRSGALRVRVFDDADQLTAHLDAWDELAVACDEPFSAPGWMLSWWRAGRCGDARLRVMLVFDGEALVGVGPFFAQVSGGLAEYRLLAAGFSHRIGPLASAGREAEVAAVLAPALAAAQPVPASVVFEGIDLANPWPALLSRAWPGRRPRLRRDNMMDGPVLTLEEGYEAWMARRGRKFRKESRRTARRLEEEGVSSRFATDCDAVEALMQLHGARWAERGGSNVEASAREVVRLAMAALASADDEPGEQLRIGIVLLETSEAPVAAELVVRAGRRLVFWSGGFDPAWAKHAPGTQAILVTLEQAAESGVATADLGGGDHAYKLRLADANEPLVWCTLFPIGPRYPLIRLRLAPKQARVALRELAQRLPPEQQARLRALRGRLRNGRGSGDRSVSDDNGGGPT